MVTQWNKSADCSTKTPEKLSGKAKIELPRLAKGEKDQPINITHVAGSKLRYLDLESEETMYSHFRVDSKLEVMEIATRFLSGDDAENRHAFDDEAAGPEARFTKKSDK